MNMTNLDAQLGTDTMSKAEAPEPEVKAPVDIPEPTASAPDTNLHVESDPIPEAPQEQESQDDIADPYEQTDEVQEGQGDPEASENVDEYGNETGEEKPRLFTQEEVNGMINEAVRDRMSRGSFKQQEAVADSVKDNFQFDANNEDTYEQQLEQFVEHTLDKMMTKRQQREVQEQEQAAQQQFQGKFQAGMSKFQDFNEVVGGQPFSDAMLMGTRSFDNPAAFVYAASKRHPEEIQRIAKMKDPYAQIAAIGRLDEKMRKPKPRSKVPKPISKTQGDTSPKMKKKDNTPPSLDDMLAQNDAKRNEQLRKARRV